MSLIKITIDPKDIGRLANLMAAAGDKAPEAVNRALLHSGKKAMTQMRRALVKQTGLKYGVMVRALKIAPGNPLTIYSRGGNVRLRFFSPRETQAGVTHKSPKRGSPVPGAFMTGGRAPKRVHLKMGSRNVFMRRGTRRLPIDVQRSNVWIPKEMITGESEKVFYDTVLANLPDRLAHELLRVLGG